MLQPIPGTHDPPTSSVLVPSADLEGLFCVRFSGDADVAGPVQSVGMLTPLVPLLGTAKGRELEVAHV